MTMKLNVDQKINHGLVHVSDADGNESSMTWPGFVAHIRSKNDWSDGEFDGGNLEWLTSDSTLSFIINGVTFTIDEDNSENNTNRKG